MSSYDKPDNAYNEPYSDQIQKWYSQLSDYFLLKKSKKNWTITGQIHDSVRH